VSDASFPGPGPDGEQPPSGEPARDEAEDDFDMDAEMASYLAEIDAGREQIPGPWEEVPACTVSLGDAYDADPAELAAMCGPDGLGGEAFAQDKAAGALRPGPVLSALTEQAAEDMRDLTDNGLLGAVSAVRRLRNRADYLETVLVAEFARRRARQFEAARAARVPRGCRDGEFADAELAMELRVTDHAASNQMEMAADLTSRLPRTLAGMAAGVIDAGRAGSIWYYTQFLSDDDAAAADAILAAAAPHLRADLLARRAAKLEMKLDPEGTQRRKEEARNRDRRVEARREASGNASLAGRELAVEDVMAAKAQIDADAIALRNGGMAGSLQYLRTLAYTDRLQGLNPLDRLTRTSAPGTCAPGTPGPGTPGPGTPDTPGSQGGRGDAPGPGDGRPAPSPDAGARGRPAGTGADEDEGPWDSGYDEGDGDEGDEGGPGGPGSGPQGPGTPAGGLAPLPALINLIVPAGTLLGWSHTPGEAGTWGLTDPADTRRIVQAASRHPRTRWCVTVTGPDGTASAHGCAPGQHPWTPEPAHNTGNPRDGTGNPRDGDPPEPGDGPSPNVQQAARLADLLRRLGVTLAPIAKGSCDHRHREDRYTPSRKLKHLVRARTIRCSAPGCGAQAINCDLDHSIPYPSGITCECDLGPACRRHHKCKQAPGWRLEQPEPGLMQWTTPSGRVYVTRPTVYDI
jgi:hypothetical protein